MAIVAAAQSPRKRHSLAASGRAARAATAARARPERQEAKAQESERKAEQKRRAAEERAQLRAQKQQEKEAEKAAKAVAKAAAKASRAASKAAAKAAAGRAKCARAKAKPAALDGTKAKRTAPEAVSLDQAAAGDAALPPAKRRRGPAQDAEDEPDLDDGEALGAGVAALAEQVLGGASAIARDKASWVAAQVSLESWRVAGAAKLFEEGNTLPFIARYRKEQTGSLNEEQLRLIERNLGRADALEGRRARVAVALHKKGALTDELRGALLGATVLEEVEDIWAPFKSKRQTRAQLARARGLAPLAKLIEKLGAGQDGSPHTAAVPFVNEELGVPGVQEALAGARDIVAERCAGRSDVKQHSRKVLEERAYLKVKRKGEEDQEARYQTYWDFTCPLKHVKPYQFLAAQRGESQKCLRISFDVPGMVSSNFTRDLASRARTVSTPLTASAPRGGSHEWEHELSAAADDAYKRLLLPSLEREWRRRLKEKAEDDAFDTFRRNLRAKLMLPPLRMHPEWGEACKEQPVVAVLGIDPAYRTGCKLALIAMTGQVLATKTVYPHPPTARLDEASAGLRELLSQGLGKGNGRAAGGPPRLICSIGNGTASRETEAWLRGELKAAGAADVAYSIVDEAGASVYSASPLAVKELPGMDVSMRGAVSIARRLLDPLSELVKIDPQSIGVGLYQHDVDQKRLGKELKAGTEDCVNAVGVDLNTASPSLLGHVAGLSASLAKAIVAYREESGFFASRQAMLAVKGLGQKSFHQAAGFLRVHGGDEPLDALPVHPESYKAARALKKRCGARMEHLAELGGTEVLAADLGVGSETLADIASALAGSEIDPRKEQPSVRVKLGLGMAAGLRPNNAAMDAQEAGLTVEMLQPGMRLEGVVRNVVAFGAFVDIGVGHDGLLHVKEYPRQAEGGAKTLSVNDRIEVRIVSAAPRGAAEGRGKGLGKGFVEGRGKGWGKSKQSKQEWRIGLSMREAWQQQPY